MARYDLSESEWRLIEPLLPNKPRGVARVDDRRVINGIFYVLRTGSPWRDLPDRYGPYTTVQPLQQMGAGWGLAADLRDASGEVASIDAADRQLHHPGSPARRRRKKGGPDHAIGRSREGLSTKIHAVVDQDGLPVRIILTAGQASDMTAVPELLAGLPIPAPVVADRGYDSNAVLDLIRRSGAEPSIPSTSQRTVRRSVDMAIYRQRNLVERFFCKLKHFRRIATRFDKLARNFLAAVLIASTRLWLRAL